MILRAAAVSALSLATLLGTGCGGADSCKTESPAKVSDLPGTCSAIQPGATVSVGIALCPTCNQTGATCTADTSQLGVGGSTQIFLDPVVQACQDTTSCPNANPICLSGPVQCTFRAPTAPGLYQITALDPLSGFPITRDFNVVSGGTQTSCST